MGDASAGAGTRGAEVAGGPSGGASAAGAGGAAGAEGGGARGDSKLSAIGVTALPVERRLFAIGVTRGLASVACGSLSSLSFAACCCAAPAPALFPSGGEAKPIPPSPSPFAAVGLAVGAGIAAFGEPDGRGGGEGVLDDLDDDAAVVAAAAAAARRVEKSSARAAAAARRSRKTVEVEDGVRGVSPSSRRAALTSAAVTTSGVDGAGDAPGGVRVAASSFDAPSASASTCTSAPTPASIASRAPGEGGAAAAAAALAAPQGEAVEEEGEEGEEEEGLGRAASFCAGAVPMCTAVTVYVADVCDGWYSIGLDSETACHAVRFRFRAIVPSKQKHTRTHTLSLSLFSSLPAQYNSTVNVKCEEGYDLILHQ